MLQEDKRNDLNIYNRIKKIDYDDCKVGNVQVVIRTKNQRNTDRTGKYLWNLMKEGKVATMVSVQKLVRENELLVIENKEKKKENEQLKKLLSEMEQEFSKSRENESYLVNQIREKNNEIQAQNQKLEETYIDLEKSTIQNQQLVTQIQTLQKISQEQLIRYNELFTDFNSLKEMYTVQSKELKDLQEQNEKYIKELTKKIANLTKKNKDLDLEHQNLMAEFVEQSKALDNSTIQMTNLMQEKLVLNNDILTKDQLLNNLQQETLHLQSSLVGIQRQIPMLNHMFYNPLHQRLNGYNNL